MNEEVGDLRNTIFNLREAAKSAAYMEEVSLLDVLCCHLCNSDLIVYLNVINLNVKGEEKLWGKERIFVLCQNGKCSLVIAMCLACFPV